MIRAPVVALAHRTGWMILGNWWILRPVVGRAKRSSSVPLLGEELGCLGFLLLLPRDSEQAVVGSIDVDLGCAQYSLVY